MFHSYILQFLQHDIYKAQYQIFLSLVEEQKRLALLRKVQLNNNLIPGRLALTSHGKQNIIGKYLSTEERTIVAEKIKSSLHNWKNRYL